MAEGRMDETERLAALLDDCIQRIARGEPLASVLRDHAADAPALEPLLRAAHATLRDVPHAPAAARERALRATLARLDERSAAPRPASAWPLGLGSRPLAFRLAAALGAVGLFGAAAIGTSAATGTAPQPVRQIFRIDDDHPPSVEFTGVLAAAEGATLTVEAPGGARTVLVNDATELRRGGGRFRLEELRLGESVEVKGTLDVSNRVLATRLRLEEERSGPPGFAPAPTHVRDGDDGRGLGENSGPGSENSGPGSQDDDAGDDDGDDDSSDDDGADATRTPEADDDDDEPDETQTPDDHEEDDEEEHEDEEPDNSGPGGG